MPDQEAPGSGAVAHLTLSDGRRLCALARLEAARVRSWDVATHGLDIDDRQRVLQCTECVRRLRGPSSLPGLAKGTIKARLAVAMPYLPPRRFTLDGQRYRYCNHGYNRSYSNERAVEVPVAASLAERGGRILEVGNVMRHYGFERESHWVVDKYERDPRAQNVDILDFRSDEPFDTILCLSTLEHVGFDEEVVDPDKPIRAMEHLRELLASDGTMLVTIPLGYNRSIIARLDDLGFDRMLAMRRVPGTYNRWEEAEVQEVLGTLYGPNANAVVFGWATGT